MKTTNQNMTDNDMMDAVLRSSLSATDPGIGYFELAQGFGRVISRVFHKTAA
ncbi:hypothetical protein [Bifidobacterium sp. UBA744]|uniref:hypothetical protein n=1 Tax=Bifidobacterium sp. UBA744 TaxID=1946112 RepID=UPI0025C1BC7C|nr:hypothetical protein [Bifidobacterium sp. UBA744]